MYLVAIAWIYVIIMMAASERSFAAGALTFVLYGVLPLAVIAFLFGRRRKAGSSGEASDGDVDQHDRPDAERDQ